MGNNNYVTYHLHTENSLLDSCTNYKLYVDRAVQLGQSAIAFTEHGNIYNWVEKKMYCDSKGIKYIHGIEVYLTETLEEKVRDNFHTILLAKNYEGVKEINKLFGLSHNADHFYYKPRITFEEFCNISSNVIATSACLQSPLNYWRIHNKEFDKDRRATYLNVAKRYDYLEIQYHNTDDQKEFNRFLHGLSAKMNIPLIAGTDTHSVDSYKAECRTILQYGKEIIFSNEDEFDLTYKTYDELVKAFDEQGALPMNVVLDAIENTNQMSNMIEPFELDLSFKYPILYGDKDEAVLMETIKRKLSDKLSRNVIDKNDIPKYKANIQEELQVFKEIGMSGFMLFMSELITWCWENGIPVGFCRGSVGGCTIAYITDITDVNPIVWNTVFSRFANKDRKEIGDIDIDVSPSQRQLVFDYIINRFGKDKTAHVLSMGTVQSKGCIDLIGKALKIKWEREGAVGDNPYPLDKVKRIKDEFEADEVLAREKYSELFYYYDGLFNTIISQSMHPAGIIASPISLDEHYGCFEDSEGHKILSINMEEAHEVSLVKYDILGLQNIEIIKDTCTLANIPYPKSHEIDWDDTNVWEDMIKYPTGIFQFEGDYAFECLRKMNPHKINDMSLANAALRPSGESYREDLFAGKIHKNPSVEINELLKDNRGFLCLDESQLIPTTIGLKKISDIEVGDKIYTSKGIQCVNKKYDNGYKQTYTISTPFSNIICTDNHPILTQHGFVEAKEIVQNPGEYCIAHVTDNVTCSNDSNKNELKLLGWLLGDGQLHQNGGNKNDVFFYNANEKVVREFKNVVESLYEGELQVRTWFRKNIKCKGNLYKCAVNWVHRQTNTNKPIVNLLKEYNMFDKTAHEKEIPIQLYTKSREDILTFLGAYADTDCCLKNQGNPIVTFHNCNERLCLGLQELLRVIGYNSRVSHDESGVMVVVNSAKELLNELYPYSIMVREKWGQHKGEINIEHPCKLGKLPMSEIIKILDDNGIKRKNVQRKLGITLYYHKYIRVETVQKIFDYYNIEYPYDTNVRYFEVIDVKPYKENSHVFDLEINNVHEFAVAGGAVVHNCFQEDVIKFLKDICGLSGGEADNVRRAIGRKQMDRLQKALPQILEGYCNTSDRPREVAEEEAKEFLQIIEDSSNYMFGQNHSTGYSMIGYTCAMLRYYYPLEFCTAYFNNARNDEDISKGTILAQSLGFKIKPVEFGKSSSDYSFDKNNGTIYKGMSSIKYMNDIVPNELLTLSKQELHDFIDVLVALKDTSVNSRQLDILIKLNFFERFGKSKYLLTLVELYNKLGKCKTIKKDKLYRPELFRLTESQVREFAGKETAKQFGDIDNLGLIRSLAKHIKNEPLSLREQVEAQYEYLGYCNFASSKIPEYYWLVVEFKTYKDKNRPYVTLHNLHSGDEVKTRIKYNKTFKANPFEKFDVLCFEKLANSPKVRKDSEGNWVETGEMEQILNVYEVVKK